MTKEEVYMSIKGLGVNYVLLVLNIKNGDTLHGSIEDKYPNKNEWNFTSRLEKKLIVINGEDIDNIERHFN